MGDNSSNDGSPVRVHVEPREHPNLAKLARALIALAQAELKREQEKEASITDPGGSGEVAA